MVCSWLICIVESSPVLGEARHSPRFQAVQALLTGVSANQADGQWKSFPDPASGRTANGRAIPKEKMQTDISALHIATPSKTRARRWLGGGGTPWPSAHKYYTNNSPKYMANIIHTQTQGHHSIKLIPDRPHDWSESVT